MIRPLAVLIATYRLWGLAGGQRLRPSSWFSATDYIAAVLRFQSGLQAGKSVPEQRQARRRQAVCPSPDQQLREPIVKIDGPKPPRQACQRLYVIWQPYHNRGQASR